MRSFGKQWRGLFWWRCVLFGSSLVPAMFGAMCEAGQVEARDDGRTVIHVKAWTLPDPTRTDTATRAQTAVLKAFIQRFPERFAECYRERYQADPAKYGNYNWDDVAVEMVQDGQTGEWSAVFDSPEAAVALLIAIVITFTLVFRNVMKAFKPPASVHLPRQVVWGFRRYRWTYFLLLPAVLSIFVWQTANGDGQMIGKAAANC